jgi:hypothetical protein
MGKGRVSLDLGKRQEKTPTTQWRSRKINKARGKGNASSNPPIPLRTIAVDPDPRKPFEEDDRVGSRRIWGRDKKNFSTNKEMEVVGGSTTAVQLRDEENKQNKRKTNRIIKFANFKETRR